MQSVNELCEKGNSLSEVGMYQEALSCFKHALEKTPETYDGVTTITGVASEMKRALIAKGIL